MKKLMIPCITLKGDETKAARDLPELPDGYEQWGAEVVETDAGGLTPKLESSKSDTNDSITFVCTNTYNPPSGSNNPSSSARAATSTTSRAATAKTSDSTSYAPVALLGAAGAAAIVVAVLRRRRRA